MALATATKVQRFHVLCVPRGGDHSQERSEGMSDTGAKDRTVEKMAQEAIEEARMVLPGIQALFGFQLIAVFNERFRQLAEPRQALHFAAMVLVAVAIALIMTPAAYHRQVHPGSVDAFFVKLASYFVTAAMVPLIAGLCLEIYLLGDMILGGAFGAAIALAILVLFAALWFVFPQVMRRQRS
jgi:hypothetical protein